MQEDLPHTRLSMQKSAKHFYNLFKRERALFRNTMQYSSSGIDEDEVDQYVSLLLNRLLFLYFLQQKGLLDNDKQYLSHHLQLTQMEYGPDRFYRCFLLRFFYEGSRAPTQTTDVRQHFGAIPCFGESLFTRRPLESEWSGLSLPDTAFARLFEFFDGYNWTLEETGEEAEGITPTALGYLFEQYVNQQQMGAYYTKNDVTIYIAQNTIIPSLFDTLTRSFPQLSDPGAYPWKRLQEEPDRYIRDAIKCQRYLSTETACEYEERQRYYRSLKSRLEAGQFTTIDDLITANLDIEVFARDVIDALTDAAMLHTCYKQLKQMTILDPTCGSGAFLFAALRVLLPLYQACLDALSRGSVTGRFDPPHAEHVQASKHRYSILQMIMSNNLYGIDIMEDAVEVCKLRLFLTLFAQVEYIDELEPLPQLTRTIQVGNLLIDASDDGQKWVPNCSDRDGTDGAAWRISLKDILDRGGFAVIVGNPPYVEFTERALPYKLGSFDTSCCSNLYTCVVECSRKILAPGGRHGMILPLAAFSTRNMQPFLDAFRRWFPVSWLSFYHFRPSMLFSGGKVASIATAIYIAKTTGIERRFSTRLLKWPQEERDLLFPRLTYYEVSVPYDPHNRHYYPKFGSASENSIMRKVLKHGLVRNYLAQEPNQNTMYYRSAGGLYWKIFVNFPWPYHTTSNKLCYFQENFDRDVFVAVFNSSLFWWYYTVTFDTFNLKDYMLFGFRFSYPQDPALLAALRTCSEQLMADFRKHARHLKRGQTGSYTIYARKSKAIIDTIDCILAHYYGLTPEELDFILHYDSKYRMSMHHRTGIERQKEE